MKKMKQGTNGEMMNIPFIDEVYHEKNSFTKKISSELESLIIEYCTNKDFDEVSLFTAAIAAFLGRYNFGTVKFGIQNNIGKNNFLIFEKHLNDNTDDFEVIVSNIARYCSESVDSKEVYDVLLDFNDENSCICTDGYKKLHIIVSIARNYISIYSKQDKYNFRLSDFINEFEFYFKQLLITNCISIDKSVKISISSSIEKYYLEEELKKVFGCFNITAILSNEEVGYGDSLHIIIYSLWDIVNLSKSSEENCNSFSLYNSQMLENIGHNTIAVILSNLTNICYSNEIVSKIDLYKSDFINGAKLFCNAVLDFSGYSKTDIYNNALYRLTNIPYKKEFFDVLCKEIVWSYLGIKKKSCKLIVLDGDETLWDGIISDDGIENIRVGDKKKNFQKQLKVLKNKGVLLAICSKNNTSDVENLLNTNNEMILKKNDFISIIANYEPKFDNITKLSCLYNIGLNNIVFIDDSTFECGEMMQRVPEVTTLLYMDKYDFGNLIQSIMPFHNIVMTAEDSLRTTTTQNRSISETYISKESFWKELDAHYLFSYPEGDDIPRIIQLNSRVNRFRLSLDELEYETAIQRAQNKKSFVIRVNDKFGDYGIVSYIAWEIQGEKAIIDNWILSCRLSVEYAEFFIWNCMMDYFKKLDIKDIFLRFDDTGKNIRFLNFCSSMGFVGKKSFIYCVSDTCSNKYRNVYATFKIGQSHVKKVENIKFLDCDEKFLLSDYVVPQTFYDVSESCNSRNVWLMLSSRQLEGDLYLDTQEIYTNIEKASNNQEKVKKLWERVLKTPVSDADKSFIKYGGNSILYMELLAVIVNYWNIDINIVPFKLDNTVNQHVQMIEKYQDTNQDLMLKIDKKEFKIPGFSERFFAYPSNSLALHIPIVIRLETKNADKETIEKVIEHLLERYRVFRSSYYVENNQIMTIVQDQINVEVNEHYTELEIPNNNFFDSLIQDFEFDKPPLVHIDLIHCINDKYLMIDYCHVIVDGLSASKITNLIIDEILGKNDNTLLLENAFDYYDYYYNYERNISKKFIVSDTEYWENELSGVEVTTEFPVPYEFGSISVPVRVSIEKSLFNKIEQICVNRDITEFSFFLSTYALFLHLLFGRNDVNIGIPINCKKGFDSIYDIGQYVNTLVFRSRLSNKDESISSFYDTCNFKYLEDIQHSRVMFQDIAKLYRKKYGIDTLFNTIFAYEYEHIINAKRVDFFQNSYKSDLDLNIIRRGNKVDIQANFDVKKLSYESVKRLVNLFYFLLKDIVEKLLKTGTINISTLRLGVSESIRSGVKNQKKLTTVVNRFLEIVKNNQNNICFGFTNQMYTYKDVNNITNCLAEHIISRVGNNQKKILVICDNAALPAFSILGVMKSGNVYIPVSSLSPEARINEIIERCEVSAYIADNPRDFITRDFIKFDSSLSYGGEKDINYTDVDNDAYIIYTSGTTGKSKGVVIKHKGLANTLQSRNEILNLTSSDNAVMLMGAASDGYMTSFFSPIMSGAVINFPESIFQIKSITNVIRNVDIRTFLCTPTMYNSILNFVGDSLLNKVRLVALAGENISESLIEKSKKLYPKLTIANEYGPTENSICTSINADVKKGQIIDAGKLIGNVNGVIRNENGINCPDYIIGELCLSGCGLTSGYIGEEDYNSTKFFLMNDVIWYKTGDLAYWDKDNNIHIVGRADSQVKINGYRVDLNEIHNVLMKYPGIDSCAVGCDDLKKLIVYYVSGNRISKKDVVAYLGTKLNRYMIPLNYIRVSSIPVTEIGKTNPKELEKYMVEKDCESDLQIQLSNDDPTLISIVDIYRLILNESNVQADSDFFDMGGSSLECVLLVEKILEQFGVGIGLEDIRLNSTPKRLAFLLRAANQK